MKVITKVPWPENAAKYAWGSFLAALLVPTCLNIALTGPSTAQHPEDYELARMMPGIMALLLTVSGIGAGVAALIGTRKYGKKRIMAPAVTGICLHVGFILLAWIVLLPALQAAREAAEKMQEQEQREQRQQPPPSGG